jgi:1,4-dihydroxy-2-naphthoate polyprenyltransferase
MNKWLEASRPKTLLLATAPVISSWSVNNFVKPWLILLILITAISLQILSNLVNDLFDFIFGADTHRSGKLLGDNIGPTRTVQKGIISPKEMTVGITILLFINIILGSILVYSGGFSILIIGIISIIVAFMYTCGPYPLGYYGWGEFLAWFFFGHVAFLGTSWLISNNVVKFNELLLSNSFGLYAATVILINNIRDVEFDKKAGKRTLVVRIGVNAAKNTCVIFLFLSTISPFLFYFIDKINFLTALMPSLTVVPINIYLIKSLITKQHIKYNKLLGVTVINSFLLATTLTMVQFLFF